MSREAVRFQTAPKALGMLSHCGAQVRTDSLECDTKTGNDYI
jgi:hypothetical protein